ncbi:MAG: nucleoside triphosphate pyrophosphohydrolase [Desulfobacula sp.]|nr:nucleoside triphosphate pyrophosphohydrolase [Desulfobacula sp.]
METLDSLSDIIRTLRGKGGSDGCAWDKQQTAQTMWKCLAEEVYELEDAISKQDLINVCEELGDVLFQLVFIIEIFQEKKAFTLSDVIEQVAQKMIRRHPHVYEDAVVTSKEDLDLQWDRIKAREKQEKSPDNQQMASVLDRVPRGMPSLLRALKVSKCVVKEGFDWDTIQQVIQTAREEMDEFEAALSSGNQKEAVLEFGDILFSLVNVARFAGFHPETALSESTTKFEGRYRLMEKELNKRDLSLKELPRDQIDSFWEAAKNNYDK